jgi:hypothetical protein
MIGDPSGKSAERNLLSRAARPEPGQHQGPALADPRLRLQGQPRADGGQRLWTAGVGYLDFLRDIGKHFSINMMVAKDSVRSRMEGEGGISYTEFSYMLLQAHDFYHLRKDLRLRAPDRRLRPVGQHHGRHRPDPQEAGGPAWGLTFPLITKADGTKFGKTEAGPSGSTREDEPLPVLPVLRQHRGRMVPAYLRKFTLLPADEIAALEGACRQPGRARGAPGPRPRGHDDRPRQDRLRRRGASERDHVRRRPRRHHRGALQRRRRGDPDRRPSTGRRLEGAGAPSPSCWSTAASAPRRARRARTSRAAGSTSTTSASPSRPRQSPWATCSSAGTSSCARAAQLLPAEGGVDFQILFFLLAAPAA